MRCLSLLRVYASVSCCFSILFVYMYVRMPSGPGSIAGVPSSQALPGYLITVCIPAVLGALAVWIQKKRFDGCGSLWTPGGLLPSQHKRRGIVFRVLFQEAGYSFPGFIPKMWQVSSSHQGQAFLCATGLIGAAAPVANAFSVRLCRSRFLRRPHTSVYHSFFFRC